MWASVIKWWVWVIHGYGIMSVFYLWNDECKLGIRSDERELGFCNEKCELVLWNDECKWAMVMEWCVS